MTEGSSPSFLRSSRNFGQSAVHVSGNIKLSENMSTHFVKPPEVHSLLRVPRRRRQRTRSLTGDGDGTIPVVTSSPLQCQAVTDQSVVVGAVSTAAIVLWYSPD